MRVLLVEDDAPLAQAMEVFLKNKGFGVHVADSLANAKSVVSLASWGVILLDLHLPDGDGLSLLPVARKHVPDASVIILTARDQISDRIRGLDAGADDYLVKPFDPDELLARLRAIDRRRSGHTSALITVGDIVVDLSRDRVSVKGFPVDLTAKEWSLLRIMVARPDRIHSKEALGGALYGFDDDVSSNTLEVFISSLRRKLGHSSIQTFRGQGYRLTGDSNARPPV